MPPTYNAPMSQVLNIGLHAKSRALLFESSNPRHAHEWRALAEADLPDGRILFPRCHRFDHELRGAPQARCRPDRAVRRDRGKERILAGSDCGFSTFAGFGAVDPDIAFVKLASLSAGAAIASDELW